MKREVKNYILIGMIFLVILMIVSLNLMSSINWLLISNNNLVKEMNSLNNTQIHQKRIVFFGKGYNDINFLIDFLTIIIILLMIIIFLWILLLLVNNENNYRIKKIKILEPKFKSYI